MDIRIYIGPHKTASKHIANILEKNKDLLHEQNVAVISLEEHRELLNALADHPENDDDFTKILDGFIDKNLNGKKPKHMVIMDPRIYGSATRPIGGRFIYPSAIHVVKKHEKLFGNFRRTYFMATRNLSSFVTSCYSESLSNAKVINFDKFISDIDFMQVRWSETFTRIINRFQGMDDETTKLVTWKFEDYPKIWRQVCQVLTGIENPQELQGSSDPIGMGLSLYGSQLMYRFLLENPPKEIGDFEKIRQSFVQKFPSNLPNADKNFWTDSQLEDFHDSYEDDHYYISKMDNVRIIHPQADL